MLDYTSVQAALDAAVDGDRVYFPGQKAYATTTGWTISKRLGLFGDGPGGWSGSFGSILSTSSTTAPRSPSPAGCPASRSKIFS